MGSKNTNTGGFGSKHMREIRMEMFLKALKRKQNLEGCTNRNIRKEQKIKEQNG
jgi:hypothetical protein